MDTSDNDSWHYPFQGPDRRYLGGDNFLPLNIVPTTGSKTSFFLLFSLYRNLLYALQSARCCDYGWRLRIHT
jgi:hypothetical protein